MEKTKVRAYFLLVNDDDFPIDEVTKQLNIQPTITTKVGEACL